MEPPKPSSNQSMSGDVSEEEAKAAENGMPSEVNTPEESAPAETSEPSMPGGMEGGPESENPGMATSEEPADSAEAEKPGEGFGSETPDTPSFGGPTNEAEAENGDSAEPAPESSMPAMGPASADPAPKPTFGVDPSDSDDSDEAGSVLMPTPLVMSSPKKARKWLPLAVIAACAVLLLGGSSAAAYYYYAMNKPENVLKMALGNAMDTTKSKSLKYSGSITVNESSSKMKLEGTYQGVVDNDKGAFDLSSKIDAVVTNLTFDMRSTDGKTFYIKLGGLNGLSSLISASGGDSSGESAALMATYAPLIDAVNDQWIEINQSVISQLTGNSDLKFNKLSDADRQKLVNAYEQNSFLVIKQKLADEDIKGTKSHHYKVGIDKTKLKAFAAAVKDAKVTGVTVTQDQLNELNKSIDSANLDSYPVDVWIGKSSKMLTQVQMQASDKTATASFVFTIDSYNQPVDVQKPANSKSLLELLGGAFGQGGQETTLPLGSGISL